MGDFGRVRWVLEAVKPAVIADKIDAHVNVVLALVDKERSIETLNAEQLRELLKLAQTCEQMVDKPAFMIEFSFMNGGEYTPIKFPKELIDERATYPTFAAARHMLELVDNHIYHNKDEKRYCATIRQKTLSAEFNDMFQGYKLYHNMFNRKWTLLSSEPLVEPAV